MGFQDIILKLDAFIRKYYKNQLLKGLIYSVALGLSLWLFISVLEYFGSFGTTVRTVLFFSFALSLAFILYRFILIPILKLSKIGKTISHKQAAEIVGTHFSEIKDKLLNTLQLSETAKSEADNTLLLASIEQRTKQLAPFPFQNAIDYSVNKKYIKYAIIPLFITILILVFSPGVLTKSTERIVKFNQEFIPEAPFSFLIQSDAFEVNENEDYLIDVQLDGSFIPTEVYVLVDGNSYRMRSDKPGHFSYLVKNVRKDFSFSFKADGFDSQIYNVKVIAKSAITGLKIRAEYPAYLQKQMEEFVGVGDLMVPEGTVLHWNLNTKNTQKLAIILAKDSAFVLENGPSFQFRRKLLNSVNYSLIPISSIQSKSDSFHYSVQVIKDAFPTIDVQDRADSVVNTLVYFLGNIQDDYGFKSLSFHYGLSKSDSEPQKYLTQNISFSPTSLKQDFLYAFNFATLQPQPGDKIFYYFSVGDNDGVNGSKISRTSKFVYRIPSKEEIREQNSRASESIKSNLSESVKQARQLQKEAEKLNNQLTQKRNLDWQDKKKIEELLKKQAELEKRIEELKKENEINNFKKDQFSDKTEEERLKEEQLQKLLEDLMSDELKELMEKLEKLKDINDPKQLKNELDQMKNNTESLEKQLERTLELYKQMELEQLLQNAIDDLNKLAEEQKNLAKETEKLKDKKDEGKKEELLKKQEDLNKEFDNLKKQLDEIEQKNQELERPNEELKNTDEQQEKISEEQKSSMDEIKKGNEKKASEKQQNASDQMQQLSQQLQQQQQQMEDNNQEEDLESMRRLLDNLLKLSFQQEEIIKDLNKTPTASPTYKEIARRQRKLEDDAKVIEDSLQALAKRQAQISSNINKELSELKSNIKASITHLGDRYVSAALSKQQYAMSHINNLALMLSESIENAQQQMMQMKGSSMGNKACKKPGQGNPSPSDMKKMSEMQKALGEQMRKMAQQKSEQQKKDGNQPKGNENGQPKPGERNSQGGGEGGNEDSKEFARMAQQQAQLKKMLQEMIENSKDPEQRKLMQDILRQMDETETDLFNKRITAATMKRQNDILSKMLESEKALREQDEDDNRESNTADTYIPENIQKYLEWKKLQEGMKDVIRTVPADLLPYYRNKVQDYFNKGL